MVKENETTAKGRAARRAIQLRDLAQFRIADIEHTSSKQVVLKGFFNHLVGVRRICKMGFLYISRRNSIYGELQKVNWKTGAATFVGWPTARKLREGDKLPYVDRYFDPAQVARALEPATVWKRVRYRAKDMVRYCDPAVPGWWTSE